MDLRVVVYDREQNDRIVGGMRIVKTGDKVFAEMHEGGAQAARHFHVPKMDPNKDGFWKCIQKAIARSFYR